MRYVIDTNVLVTGLRSNQGTAFQFLSSLGSFSHQLIVSTPLVLEYEDVLNRPGLVAGISQNDIADFIDYLISISEECRIHFLGRPFLPDPKDDMVLELALAGGADYIVTYNKKDFTGIEQFGLQTVTPGEFLNLIASL